MKALVVFLVVWAGNGDKAVVPQIDLVNCQAVADVINNTKGYAGGPRGISATCGTYPANITAEVE